MGDELFCSTWANRTIPTVFFPAIFFFSELLYPSIFINDVDCAFRILQLDTLSHFFWIFQPIYGLFIRAFFVVGVNGGVGVI